MGNTLERLEIAQNLRSRGINVDIEMNNKKVKKALNYANVENIPYVIIIGDDELKKSKVILKDMKTGEQKEVEMENIVDKVFFETACGYRITAVDMVESVNKK